MADASLIQRLAPLLRLRNATALLLVDAETALARHDPDQDSATVERLRAQLARFDHHLSQLQCTLDRADNSPSSLDP